MTTKKAKPSTKPRRSNKAKPAAFFSDPKTGLLRVLEIQKAESDQEADAIGAEQGMITFGFGRVWPDDGIAVVEATRPLRYDPSSGVVEGVR